MTIAIKWGDEANDEIGGLIYFDAVTSYTKNYRGQVTKHPVDGGANITDHFIRENPTFNLSGVISGVDISLDSFLIGVNETGYAPYNTSLPPNPVSVNSTDQSVLRKFIPDSLGQFLSDSTPEIRIDVKREEFLEGVRDLLINLMSGVKFNEVTGQFDPKVQLIKIFEYDGLTLKRSLPSNSTEGLVITNITFKEDLGTGYGLFCDLTIEQVTFATLKKTTIPANVVSALKKQSADKSNKGKQDSTVVDEDELSGDETPEDDTDGLRQDSTDKRKQFELGQTLNTGSL